MGYRDSKEGPFPTKARAQEFATAEVGAEHIIAQTDAGWIILLAQDEATSSPLLRYDVNASVHDSEGHADGAYSLICRDASADEICEHLRQVLADWEYGLTNSPGPFYLSLQIGPAGKGDDMPI